MPAASTLVRAGLATFVGLVALQHVLRPDLPAAERFISEYARGWTEPVQVTAFLGWAVASAGCAALAARRHRRPVARAVTVAGFAGAAAGTLLAAAFATQTVGGELPEGVERTLAGRLHDAGTLLILAGILVAATASLRLVPSRRHRLTVGALGAALVATVPVLVALDVQGPGLGQRAFVLVGCAFEWRFAAAVADAERASRRAA